MAYASGTNIGKSAQSEPSGKGGGGTYSSKAGTAGAKSEPSSSLKSSGMTTKGNARKVGGR
jgi:hypothetical protein